MDNLTFSHSDCKEESTSIWLAAVMKFSNTIGVTEVFNSFKLKMKTYDYTVSQKLITLICSIVKGCKYNVDINTELKEERLVANMFGMEHFPDQSQISEVLSRTDENSIDQLSDIHSKLFAKNSQSTSLDGIVTVDFDQSGLIANGKSYELAQEGYFPKKRNQKGYQMSAAFIGKSSETLSLFLDPGGTHCSSRFKDLLKTTIAKLNTPLSNGELIIRGDSGYGSSENIEIMESIPNLKYVVKGYSTIRASNLAKGIPHTEYEQAAEAAWVYEMPTDTDRRIIIVQILTKKGELKYTMLVTNISKKQMSAVELFHFYNERQTIEAFFKTVKNTYGMRNLRSTKFYGIYSFLWLVFITHNIVTWFRQTMLANTPLENVGVKVLVEKVGKIKGKIQEAADEIIVLIPNVSVLARKLIDALTRPKIEQLSFL